MSDQEKQEYLEFAKSLAFEAGKIMRTYFLATNTTWKADQTPLTQADTEINSLVIDRVRQAYPEHSVYGEEESSLRESKFLWVCDPVDGTLPYSLGLPISTFSLALVVDGVSNVGVVYDPFMDRLFYATLGHGAYMNGKKISVNDKTTLENTTFEFAGFGEPKSASFETGIGSEIMDVFTRHGVRDLHLWSTVLPSVLVASGQLTATMLNFKSIQDGAAAKVIVEEAGGKFTDIHGNEQRYDEISRGFIASNGIVHDEILRIMREVSDEI